MCPPTLNQMLVSAYLRDYDWRGQIETYRGLYKERCDAMLAALDEYMPPGLSWTRPEGGWPVEWSARRARSARRWIPKASPGLRISAAG